MKRVFCMMSVLAVLGAAGARAEMRPEVHHKAEIWFDIDSHWIRVNDHITLSNVDSLHLNEAFQISRLSRPQFSDGYSLVNFEVTPREPGSPADSTRAFPVCLDGYVPKADSFFSIDVSYTGWLHESTDDVTFSRENVGREIRGTVGEEGIYLAIEGWLPYAEGAMATHHLTIRTPVGWEPVTQGRRTRHEVVGDELITVWEAVHPADGLILIANRYHVTEQQFGDVTSYTYFLADEPRLVETYMERTGAYLEMYGEMIGPYPYAKFATVENWFPTGYGMPSWTLLGGTVLRLPFIPYTSFGHEICHNWWGNSSFVDDVEGNWCEGLTVYCADYHYKELESPEAAREYRRNLLKDYVAYVHGGRDMPLRDFRSRESGASRAIGYGKAMMVFHMVDRLIGHENFLNALREVWSSHKFEPVSWRDFLDACGRHGDVDLTAYREQWLNREGAPRISLAGVNRSGDGLRVTLRQSEPVWTIDVPVVVSTPDGDIEKTVTLVGPEVSLDIVASGATAVRVDPDYHVFRRLHPQEIEPTLSMVLGDMEPRFVLPSGLLAAAGQTFAEDWIEGDDPVIVTADTPSDGHSRILINPDPATAAEWLPPGAQISGGLLFLDGVRHDLKDTDAVLAVASAEDPGVTNLLVFCKSAPRLERLAGRLSHYGKYSHLIFPARGRALKGNWPVAASPLNAELR